MSEYGYKVPEVKPLSPEAIDNWIRESGICPQCGKSKKGWKSLCEVCEDHQDFLRREKKRLDWLQARERETLEGRVKFIEEWMYAHMQNHPERQMVMR